MSRSVARLVNAVTLCACVASIACTPSDSTSSSSSSSGAKKPARGSAEGPTEVEPPPDSESAGSADAGAASSGEGETGALAAEEPGETEPAAPPDYGVFKFETPPPSEDELTLRALAGYEVVAVYSAPSKDSTHLGFLRIGTRLRVGEKIATEDCRKGWHPLEGGGYACASKGLVVDERDPFMSYQPAKARLDQPFPFDWAYVREWNTPMWWQVPSAEALAATREQRAIRESERTGEPLPGSEPAPTEDGAGEEGASAGEGGGVDELPALEGEDTGGGEGGGEAVADPAPIEDGPVEDGPAEDGPVEEEEEEPVQIPLSPSTPWLEKGYFLSLGESIREAGRSYWRTARGGIVEKSRAYPYKPKDYQGAELYEGMSFPVGFVMTKKGTKLLRLGDDDKLHATGKTLEKRTFLDLGEEVEISGHTYFTVLPYPPPGATEGEGEAEGEGAGEAGPADAGAKDGAEPEATAKDEGEAEEPALLVKADVIRLAELQPMPKGLDPWDRWIDVDISKQMLVAYEGSRPVYVTLVSTGKKGSPEEPFDTPTGRYRIYSKQITSNMDGATATDGNYAIQDVPWVMYFEGSYALHGAFWHRSFGYVRSHGCVNLGPSDARWLFNWTTPFVPEHWHGVTAGDDNPGTTVIVRESD